MAGSYAREGDMTTGHGSYPPAIFEVGSSLCQKATIEGKPILTVDVYCGAHTSPTPSPTLGGKDNPLGGKLLKVHQLVKFYVMMEYTDLLQE